MYVRFGYIQACSSLLYAPNSFRVQNDVLWGWVGCGLVCSGWVGLVELLIITRYNFAKEGRTQYPRRVRETLNEILHTCLMCPCRAFYVCSFFRHVFGLLHFWGYLSLKGSHISSDKREKTHPKRAQQGDMKHVRKISGCISQKRRGHVFGLLRDKLQKSRLLRIGISWFQCRFDFGL